MTIYFILKKKRGLKERHQLPVWFKFKQDAHKMPQYFGNNQSIP